MNRSHHDPLTKEYAITPLKDDIQFDAQPNKGAGLPKPENRSSGLGNRTPFRLVKMRMVNITPTPI